MKEKNIIDKYKAVHNTWSKFYNWVCKTYGKDLHGKVEWAELVGDDGKKIKYKTQSFNDLELSRRLCGYEVMRKVEKFIKRCCPEIKIIHCDDSLYAGSDILLIPHPKHGITIIFIPQCTTIQNQFFLYSNHYKMLMEELAKMKYVYKNEI